MAQTLRTPGRQGSDARLEASDVVSKTFPNVKACPETKGHQEVMLLF